ncbi:hypothetical protein V5O48_017298 [Marasmius crinis-equi]|uniref:Uncharacterized protein n=1 Tax=Marasmius crinis-equi TaxID=585013 RepID=A0ABR3EPE8_9AGAR
MSNRTLTPIECSPGVYFVRPQHIIPLFITVIGLHKPELSFDAIRRLLLPCYTTSTGREISLLHLASQPSPDLLPLLGTIVPDILEYVDLLGREVLLRNFMQWLKSLQPDPDYHLKTISLIRQVSDWAIRTRLQERDAEQLEYYEEVCDMLGEAGFEV